MALCRITDANGQPQYALYADAKVCPLGSLTDEVPDGNQLFAAGSAWIDSLGTDGQWQPAPAKLLPPVASPEKVICIGLNYRDHAIETGADIPTEPVVFSKFVSTIVGHGDHIQLPTVSDEVDYEAELVVVIGKAGKNVSAADAMDHVYGYTCGHDVSARDWQKGRPGGQWLLGKTFDTFAPIGPCIVTKEEIDDPHKLRVRMHLNGEVVQDSTTAQLIFDIPTLIAHLSKVTTLKPGDLIFTGTPPGVGAARTPPLFLKPGDSCSVQIDGIGTLTNQCVAE
ncbi:MAG: fumarylacetoacetate hydrolase family protein [Pirellulaceae bacterium]|nr:fumarylacetoacetate hydrolase family protein [Pirellulaceae bacterium]